jgi:hypothetical protein
VTKDRYWSLQRALERGMIWGVGDPKWRRGATCNIRPLGNGVECGRPAAVANVLGNGAECYACPEHANSLAWGEQLLQRNLRGRVARPPREEPESA